MLNRSNLDEQQELHLLKIESRGFWLAFWGLIVSLVISSVLGKDLSSLTGQWVLFFVLAVYMSVSCARAGIWDRHLGMSTRTSAGVSLISAACMGIFLFARYYMSGRDMRFSVINASLTAVFVFLICFAALRISARFIKMRQDKLNAEPGDTMDRP